MANRISVSSAEFIRNIGHWQNEAQRHPVSITHHGRERLVLATPDVFRAAAPDADVAAIGFATLRADVAAVQEHIDDGYLSFDADLRVRNSNAVAESFAGLAREDLRGAGVLDALPQPLASILSDRLQRVMRTRQSERFEVGALDGRYLSVNVFPVSIGAAAMLRNITEQHALRRRLEDGEALDQAARRHSHAAIIKLDARARIESIDETFAAWSGFDGADVSSHRVIDLVAATQRREAAELIERVLREGVAREIELKLLGKRGQEIPGVLALAPILTDFSAHGAFALFVRASGEAAAQHAA